MACYIDEAEVWKCTKHPSKRRRTGICPRCLRDRLVTLCPNCANSRPCDCCPPPPLVDSAASTSSFSLFSFSRGGSRRDFGVSGGGVEPARLSDHAETDPAALRRSRSLAIAFLRSRSRYVGGCESESNNNNNNKAIPKVSRSKIHFWSVFTRKKCDVHGDGGIDGESNKSDDLAVAEDYSRMMRSRSVAVGAVDSGFGNGTAGSRRKGWYFPSPIKAFRQTKTTKAVAVS